VVVFSPYRRTTVEATVPCIFCRKNDDLTDEHVFPAVLGGNLVVKAGSCTAHNLECGKYEQGFATETRVLRHILDVSDRYGVTPSAPAEVTVGGDSVGPLPAQIKAGGELVLHDYVANIQLTNDKTVREGFFVSEEAAQRFIERARARGERTTEIQPPKDYLILPTSTQTLGFVFSVEARRMVAKIALATIAYRYGTQYACEPQFDTLRRFVFGPPESILVAVFANKDFENSQIRTPQQHSVVGYLSAEMKKGWALVTLFGGISYVMQIAENFQESASRNFSIYYDAASKTEIQPIVLYSERALVDRVLSQKTKLESSSALDEQWFPIVARYCVAKGVEMSRIASQQ